MKGSLRITASVVAAAATMLISTVAFAQEGGGSTRSVDTDEGYGYEFSDDPLSAGGFGPSDATIRVRPGPVRRTLIRPRTSFVPDRPTARSWDSNPA